MDWQKRRQFPKTNAASSDLLAFGYACRLYEPKNDESAARIGGAQHLISWDGNDSLKIDRYDCRLYLSSLDEFERGQPIANEENATDETGAEKIEEELCDEERYRDMYEDQTLKEIEEENAKAKSQKSASIGFDYGTPTPMPKKSAQKFFDLDGEEDEAANEPYQPPKGLKLPVGIVMPETLRQNAIIEKTAMFTVANGPQMEIVIKAKFGNSSQFGFLDFDHRLHSFYKYLCKMIRENKYVPTPAKKVEEKIEVPLEAESNASDSDSDDDHYLHPLLSGSSAPKKDSEANTTAYIGPKPRPKLAAKIEPVVHIPGPDLEQLIQQFHSDRSNSKDTLYSSLFEGLHSVLPGGARLKEATVEQKDIEEDAQQQSRVVLEADPAKVLDYNRWHMEFYGRPSPYLPGAPPVPVPPPPNLSSTITIASRYVAMNGPSSEQKLIDHNGESIEFLFPRSVHYTYYQSRVRVELQALRQQYWLLKQQGKSAPGSSLPSFSALRGILPVDISSQLPSIGLIDPIQIQSLSLSQRSALLVGQSLPSPPTPPGQSSSPRLVPTELTISSAEVSAAEVSAATDIKQLERKEKARLFMEKILNEKLAAKRRRGDNNGTETTTLGEREDRDSTSLVAQQRELGTAKQALVIQSDTLSHLIDRQLKRALTGSSSATKEREESPEQRHRRRRKRSRSRETSDESDEERRRRRKERHSSHRNRSPSPRPKKSSRRRHRSRSRSRESSRRRRSHSRSRD